MSFVERDDTSRPSRAKTIICRPRRIISRGSSWKAQAWVNKAHIDHCTIAWMMRQTISHLRLPAGKGRWFQADIVKNLMLREDLVEEIRDGKFHVYPIATIDDGIELLTGIDAGERNEHGEYPASTVNHAAQARLRDLAEKVQSFARDTNHRDPVREKEISL